MKREKKTINVNRKVKKKPVYVDKRVESDVGGSSGIEFCELTPEIEAFCQLMADDTPRTKIMSMIPNMSPFKYRTWQTKENVIARIEELKAEKLIQSSSHLEPAMVSLVMSLTKYFKVKASLLDLSDSVADKVLERALEFCKVLAPISNANKPVKQKNDDNNESKSGNKKPKQEVKRKPLWSAEDYEDIDQVSENKESKDDTEE
jgi:hypothetical protein